MVEFQLMIRNGLTIYSSHTYLIEVLQIQLQLNPAYFDTSIYFKNTSQTIR